MLLSLLLAAGAALAQDNSLRVEAGSVEPQEKREWSADFRAELRSQNDQRARPQNRGRQSLHEVSVGGSYRFRRELRAAAELSAEALSEGAESSFFAKQAYVEWTPFPRHTRLTVGQQFLPVGLISPRDNWFSSNPPFLRRLFGEAKPADLGVTAAVMPLGREILSAEGGVYSGELVREADQRRGQAQRSPRAASLKSHSQYHDVFVTFFEHDLAFFDPLRAWGTGFELRSPEWKGLSASLLGELWSMEQIQINGPDERTRAYILFGQLNYKFLSAGYRYSQARTHLAFAGATQAVPDEHSQLGFVEVKAAKVLALRAERVRETQGLLLRDEWVGRLILDWEL